MNLTCQRCSWSCLRTGIALLAMWLTGCGGPGAADWLAQLESSNPEVRRDAAERLAEAAPTTPDVVAALKKATDDADAEVRRWACRGLGRHAATDSVSQLETKLKDPATPVRRAAAFSLQSLAPESTDYREEFLSGMRSGDGGLLVAVRGFEPPASWATPVLLELTKDKRAGIRRLAIEALGDIAPAMEAPRKAFDAARRDPDDRVREAAEKILNRRPGG